MSKNKDVVTLGLVQMSANEKPEANLSKAMARIREAAKKGAQIVCLQELFRSPYFCQSEDQRSFRLAETIPGPSTDALGGLAREMDVVIAASLFEKRSAGIYHNTAVVIDGDGSIVGKYRKMHIPDDPLYYEKFYFTPGDLGFPSFQTRHARVAVLVCWDQ
jgi:N-carbamoylputrescine amidase